MLVKDLEPGTEVSIESSNDSAKVNLKTKISNITAQEDKEVLKLVAKEKKSGFCVVDGIREEDCLVNFRSPRVKNNLVTIVDGKPMIWEGIGILNWKLPVYGSVHIVISTRNAVSYNRREHFRIWLGADATLRLGSEEGLLGVILKDVSEGGVSFIVRDTTNISKGSQGEISFADSGTTFHLMIVVIRMDLMEDGRTTCGCRLTSRNEALSRFINAKQQERLKTGKKKE